MKVIRPAKITDAALVSSDAPETDYPAYVASTTYAAGDHVIRTTTHRRYESLAGGNVGHTPETSPDKWLDIGPTNRWAMFDDRVGTTTVKATSLDVKVAPGIVDTLALIDTVAETAHVTMKVGATTVYDQTRSFNVGGAPITNWSAYFFEPIGRISMLILNDLPIYPSGVVEVVLTAGGAGPNVEVGTMLLGSAADLGLTEASPSIGIIDYSKKSVDDFGVTSITERAWSKRMTTRTVINTDQVDATEKLLASLRAKPVLWSADDDFEALNVFGFFKDFTIDIAFEAVSYCSLTVEGLT